MKLFLLLICGIFCLTACTNKYENLLISNTAEVREFMMEGAATSVKASLICGKREKDYKLNGYASELIEFGVLTFTLDNVQDYDETIAKYILNVGTLRYDGALEKNPFDGTLVADIKRIIDKNENVSVKLIIGEYLQDIPLKLIGADFKVQSEDVYKIVASKYKNQLKAISVNNVFEGELYIKIINDADEYKGDYYWYVSLLTRKGGKLSLIISPYTSEILASTDTITNMQNGSK